MTGWDEFAAWLPQASALSSPVIVAVAAAHLGVFALLWNWHGRDVRAIVGCLDEFTRGLRYRSVLQRARPSINQIDAFIQDINDVLQDPHRAAERAECLRRMHILDERRRYLDSNSFETVSNMARTMIEAYPLAGVLGTILAIGSALQSPITEGASTTMNAIVGRFGDAIWSTFAGLCAAILLMFVNSVLETRFARLTDSRLHVRDIVAKAKRELGFAVAAIEEAPAKGANQ